MCHKIQWEFCIVTFGMWYDWDFVTPEALSFNLHSLFVGLTCYWVLDEFHPRKSQIPLG